MMKKLKSQDEELEAGRLELLPAILKALGKNPATYKEESDHEDDADMKDDDDGYETVS
jgi:hypothetical protein